MNDSPSEWEDTSAVELKILTKDMAAVDEKLVALAGLSPVQLEVRRKQILKAHRLNEEHLKLAMFLKEKNITEVYFKGWSKGTWQKIAIVLTVIDILYIILR